MCCAYHALSASTGFINAAFGVQRFPAFFDQIYSYAWFTGLGLAAILYYLLMMNRARPAVTT